MPKPYNAELPVTGNSSNKPSGRFVAPQPNNTGSSSQETDNSNTTTVYYEKPTGKCQNKSTSIQTSPRHPESRGTTTATQTTKKKGFTGWWNPNYASTIPQEVYINRRGHKHPLQKGNPHRQVDQGQPDHNQEGQLANITSSKDKKTKKSTSKAPPHPGPSTGPSVGPRNDFTSRNLGTGRPTIQCTVCGEYSHWRRECPYDNYCTMCNNHDHATHMCRVCRQTNNNQGEQGQQSPHICVYCGSTEHSSSNCCRRPWDNREQPCSTPDSLRRDQQANSKISGNATGRTASMGANTQVHPPQSQSQRSNSENLGNTGPNKKSSQY